MARNRFRGDAPDVAQVRTFTITAVAAAGTITVTMNGKPVTYTVVGGDTVTTAGDNLVDLLSADSAPAEFRRVTWANASGVVTGTAATPGVPFTFSSTASGGTTTVSGTGTDTVASSGHWHWDDAKNWSLGTVPVSTDDVDIQDCSTDIRYGIGQSAVTLNSLNIDSTFTGKLGLPQQNSAGYYEYLATYLAIGATSCTIGAGTGSGSSMLRIDFGSVQTNLLILNTSSAGTSGQPALWLKGTNASNVANVSGGQVGLAFDLGSSMTLATLNVTAGANAPPVVQYGAGLTLGAANVQAGRLYGLAGLTTLTQDGGEVTLTGLAAVNVTTATVRGGRMYYDATGTIGTLAAYATGYVDFTRDARAKTVTNCTAYGGSTVKDPMKHVTFTNPVSAPDGIAPYAKGGANLDLGLPINVQRS